MLSILDKESIINDIMFLGSLTPTKDYYVYRVCLNPVGAIFLLFFKKPLIDGSIIDLCCTIYRIVVIIK